MGENYKNEIFQPSVPGPGVFRDIKKKITERKKNVKKKELQKGKGT